MNRLFHYITSIFAAVTVFAACQTQQPDGSQYQPAQELKTSKAAVQFDFKGGSSTVSVTSSAEVKATPDRDWVTVTVENKTVSIIVPENESLDSRYALVLIEAGGYSKNIQVIQLGVRSYYIWDDNYEVPAKGGKLDFRFPPTDETIKIMTEGSWISATLGLNTMEITVEKNMEDQERVGKVTWQAGEELRSFTITQAAGTGGDNPGGDGEGADGSYSGYLGTWTDASGNTLRLEVFPEHEGEAYIAYYSGFALDGEVVPFPAFYEDNAIIFYSAVLHEYDDAPLKIYFCAMDTDGYIELGGPDEDQKLAYSTLSNGGKSINIIGNKYKAVYSGTTYDEEIAKLMVRLYADDDYGNYQAGYFYSIGMEDLNLPASFVKGGNSTSVNTKSVKNDFWTPFMKGSLWAPQTRRIR